MPSIRFPLIAAIAFLLTVTVTVFFRVSHFAGLLLLIGEIVVISWAWIVGRQR